MRIEMDNESLAGLLMTIALIAKLPTGQHY
jgi:hypothetical protein